MLGIWSTHSVRPLISLNIRNVKIFHAQLIVVWSAEKTPRSQKLKARKDSERTASASDRLLHGHCFLPLGRLVETRGSNADRTVIVQRTMKYLVGLNISTSAISLWLVYDYIDMDEADNYIKFKASLKGAALYHDLISDRNMDDFDVIPNDSFQIGFEFDVGQICGDIGPWNARQVLTGESTKECLDKNHYLKDNSIDLRAWMPPSS